jgi:hypothetical protein
MSYGMQYLQPKFTLPAGSEKISQVRWDLAFLSKDDFCIKYDISPVAYKTLTEYDKVVLVVNDIERLRT